MKDVVNDLQILCSLNLQLIRIKVSLDSLLNNIPMVDIIPILLGHDLAPLHRGVDIHSDVLGFNYFREVLQRVEDFTR